MPTTLVSGLQGPMTPSLVVVQCLCLISDDHNYGLDSGGSTVGACGGGD